MEGMMKLSDDFMKLISNDFMTLISDYGQRPTQAKMDYIRSRYIQDMNIACISGYFHEPARVEFKPLEALSASPAGVVKPLEWQHDGSRSYAYCGVTDTRWVAENQEGRDRAERTRSARIMSAIEPAGVGVETPPPSTHAAPDVEQLKELVERARAIISTSTYPNWHANARAALATTEGSDNGN